MTTEEMADLHARAFAGLGRGWTAGEIRTFLDNPLVIAVTKPQGIALARVVTEEAELLTIACDPLHRRRGIGAAMLREVEGKARARGATRMFLEVAQTNSAARCLYARAGYGETAIRAGYYALPGGGCVDAVIMEKPL